MTPRASALLGVLLLLAPLATLGTGGGAEPAIPDRAFVLVMAGSSFNGMTHPDTPLLEAYLGEDLRFTVAVPPLMEPHTFHLHGHPWFFPEKGRHVDTVLLRPGETHSFDVVAGGPDAMPGDWMYHCHVADHQAAGMWGILRVYNYTTQASDAPGGLLVTLHRLGVPVEGAHLVVERDGAALPAQVEPLGEGRYQVRGVPAGVPLVVTAHHAELGVSVARLHGAPAPKLMGAMAH